MSYEVTATRRRPQRFDDLVGQEFVADTLKNSLKSGKIAHAYLFSGPRGCGKTSTARILAKALNCEKGPTADPCGTCTHCEEITKGSSLDVIEIDGASNTSVNDVRQIKDEVMFPPNSSRYKIYIIDEVHMLSTSAFNALLKTIEEPPPYVVFIFATTELQKVPATIKSRCQQFNFRLVPVEQVKNLLADAAKELGIQADDEALYWIASESTGSVRDSYTLFDQVASFSDGHITYDKIRDKLGLVGIDRLNTLFASCAAGNVKQCLEQLDVFLQSGIAIEQLISNSADYIRSLLLIKNGITKEALLGNAAERYSADVLAAWNTVQIERALSLFLNLYRDIRYSLSPRYEIELAFSRLCWLSQYVSAADVKKAIDAAHALLGGSPAQTVPAPRALSSASAGTAGNSAAHDSSGTAHTPGETAPASSATQAARTAGGLPSGMPHFSALDELNASAGDRSAAAPSSPDIPQTVQTPTEPHPFPDGGALPPHNTAAPAAADTRTESPSGTAAIVPSESTQAVSADSGADSDWSNTDVPPDGEYAPDDTEAEDDDRSDENSTDEEPADTTVHKVPDEPAAASETHAAADEKFASYTTAEGRTITLTQLRGSVIADLSVNDAMTASALMQTGMWKIENNVVTTEIATSYQNALLQQKTAEIEAVLTRICGRPTFFSVVLKTEGTAAETGSVPTTVKMICSVFKGTIEGGKK